MRNAKAISSNLEYRQREILLSLQYLGAGWVKADGVTFHRPAMFPWAHLSTIGIVGGSEDGILFERKYEIESSIDDLDDFDSSVWVCRALANRSGAE